MEIATRGYLSEQADAVRFELGQAAQNVVSAGKRLAEVQGHLPHGEFLVWIKSEFGMSQRHAYNLINIGKNFPILANFASFDKSALYLLSAPSTPEAARDEAKARASNGRVTHKEAREIVAEHKSAVVEPVTVEEPKTGGDEKRAPAGIRVVPPTWEETFASLSEFNKKQLGSPHVIKNAARNLYLTTLGLCGYVGVK